jgi:hypothetical protein
MWLIGEIDLELKSNADYLTMTKFQRMAAKLFIDCGSQKVIICSIYRSMKDIIQWQNFLMINLLGSRLILILITNSLIN